MGSTAKPEQQRYAFQKLPPPHSNFPTPILKSINGLLGSDKEDMLNQNSILTLTCLNGLLGSNKQDMLNEKGILTLTSLNGLLGSD